MAAAFSTRSVVMIVVAAVAAAGLGYWGYNTYQKRQLRGAVAEALQSAGEMMRDALAVQAGPLPADRAGPAQKLEDHGAAIEKTIAQFKGRQLQHDRELTDAADSYLVTVREIFRMQGRMYRAYQRHTESLDALRDHMRVDDRRGAWVSAAVRAKDRAERDFRDYRLANASYATLLGSLPATQKKIEHAAAREALAAPDQIERARERALAIANEAEVEMEKVRKVVGPK